MVSTKIVNIKMKYTIPNYKLIHKNYNYPIKSFLNGEGLWTYTDLINHNKKYNPYINNYMCHDNGNKCHKTPICNIDSHISKLVNDPFCLDEEGNCNYKVDNYYEPSIKPTVLLNIDTWKKIYYYQEGQNDFKEWIVAFQTKDGIYVYFRASCDYTGFDCQGGGDISFTKDRDIFWNFCLDQFGRNLILEQSGIKMKIEIGGSLNKYWKKHKNN